MKRAKFGGIIEMTELISSIYNTPVQLIVKERETLR